MMLCLRQVSAKWVDRGGRKDKERRMVERKGEEGRGGEEKRGGEERRERTVGVGGCKEWGGEEGRGWIHIPLSSIIFSEQ